MKLNTFTLVMCLLLTITGCTKPTTSASLVDSITDTVKDILSPSDSDPARNTAEKQVVVIQESFKQDTTYALSEDDVVFLKTEGLAVNETEIKAWVK